MRGKINTSSQKLFWNLKILFSNNSILLYILCIVLKEGPISQISSSYILWFLDVMIGEWVNAGVLVLYV